MLRSPIPKNTAYCDQKNCLQTVGFAIWNSARDYFCINFMPDPAGRGALPGVAFLNDHIIRATEEPLLLYVHFTQEEREGSYTTTTVPHVALVNDNHPHYCYENLYLK